METGIPGTVRRLQLGDAMRSLCCLFKLRHTACIALSPVGASAQAQPPIIKETVSPVLVPVVVTDRAGHHVTGLKPDDFRLFEDGIPQQIVALLRACEKQPLANALKRTCRCTSGRGFA